MYFGTASGCFTSKQCTLLLYHIINALCLDRFVPGQKGIISNHRWYKKRFILVGEVCLAGMIK